MNHILSFFQGPSHNIDMVNDSNDFLEGGGEEVNYDVKLIIIRVPLSAKIFLQYWSFILLDRER